MADVPVAQATLQVFRGNREEGKAVDYRVPLVPGMVVLDALHSVQAHQAPDLAVRWNCKAGKCGSCSAEGKKPPPPPFKKTNDFPSPSPTPTHLFLETLTVTHVERGPPTLLTETP